MSIVAFPILGSDELQASNKFEGTWDGGLVCGGSGHWNGRVSITGNTFSTLERFYNIGIDGKISDSGSVSVNVSRSGNSFQLSGTVEGNQLTATGTDEARPPRKCVLTLLNRTNIERTVKEDIGPKPFTGKEDIGPKPFTGPIHLYSAIWQNDSVEVRRLIAAGYDVNIRNNDGNTPLHIAASKGDVGIIQQLLAAGARPDERNLAGLTPLRAAELKGHTQAMALLSGRTSPVAGAAAPGSPLAQVPSRVDEKLITECTLTTMSPIAGRARSTKVSPSPDTRPKLYALAVGVSRYKDGSMNLRYAAKDACDVGRALAMQEGGLYRQVVVRVIQDESATREGVLEGLEWVVRETTARDVAMVFVAGHGVNDASGEYFFLPHDADLDRLTRTAIPQTDLRRILLQVPGKAMFFFDTCHSGQIMSSRRSLPPDISRFVDALVAAENGVIVFSASTGRQFAAENDAWGNGAFTKALLEGLSGKADFRNRKVITLTELDLWISERVKELTGGRQSPTVAKPVSVQDFPIAIVQN